MYTAKISINIPIIKLTSASSLSRGVFYEDDERNTVRPNEGPRLFLSLKESGQSCATSTRKKFHLHNVYLVTGCIIVNKCLWICIRSACREVEGNIQLILVFLVLEWERGRLVDADSHEVVSSADFTSEDTRLWLNDIETNIYALHIILAGYLRNFEYTSALVSFNGLPQ